MTVCGMSDRRFGRDYIDNPKKKIDPLMVQLLTEYPQNQVTIQKIIRFHRKLFCVTPYLFFTVQPGLQCNA